MNHVISGWHQLHSVTIAAMGCQQVISGWHQLHSVVIAAMGCQQVIPGRHQLHSVTIAAMACQQVISGYCANNHQWQTTAMGAVNRLSQVRVLWQSPMTDNCHGCCQQVISGEDVVTTTTNDRQLPRALSTGYLRVLWQQLLWAVNRLSQGAATTTTNDRQLPQGLSIGFLRVLWQQLPCQPTWLHLCRCHRTDERRCWWSPEVSLPQESCENSVHKFFTHAWKMLGVAAIKVKK